MSHLDTRVRAGPVDVTLTGERGETVAVLGPNGAGKTTLLRALAGLVRLDDGWIRLAGNDIARLAAHDRRVGLVPQRHALLPHLSVRANVGYGLRSRRVGRRAARERADDWLDRLDVAALANRKPATLSGGQSQRVALARALATEPELLLLDEPLAAVDAEATVALRRTLREHLGRFDGTCLLVTHDPVEAVTLADRLVVVERGAVVQVGGPAEVMQQPRSPWIARMLGLNAHEGTMADGAVQLVDGGTLVAADPPPDGTEVLATVSPESVALYPTKPDGSPRNTWQGTVGEVSAVGGRVRVHVHGAPDIVAEVTPAAAATLGLAAGATIWLSVKATEVRLTPL
ncbi:MAG: ATP-binding cassette domain-containing protein [Streptosporangiales bacterium]|nr:ATP-binding cassette domain-containing protein [Streptosporangiales bacterium]